MPVVGLKACSSQECEFCLVLQISGDSLPGHQMLTFTIGLPTPTFCHNRNRKKIKHAVCIIHQSKAGCIGNIRESRTNPTS